MSRLIIPGRRDSLTILIPDSAKHEEPGFVCMLCDSKFAKERFGDYERHVARCAKLTHDQTLQEREDSMIEAFRPHDPEVAAHMRQVGKRMLKEGRWTVNENEKAGFS